MTAWKALERKTAELLRGWRVSRADDWGRSDTDVKIRDFDIFAVDCKYRSKSWAHHTFLREVAEKYCQGPQNPLWPILVTKARGEQGEGVTMRLRDFSALLDLIRSLRKQLQAKESLLQAAKQVYDATGGCDCSCERCETGHTAIRTSIEREIL